MDREDALKRTADFFRKQYNRLSLAGKFKFILYFLVICSLIGSIGGFWYLYRCFNKMFYRSIDSSLEYSAGILSDTLNDVNHLTTRILSDSSIQKALSAVKDDSATGTQKSDAFSDLLYAIPDYYWHNRQYHLTFIDLYNDSYAIHSDVSKSNKIPAKILEQVIAEANALPGYTIWNTDFCEEYGLFLGREIRRAENLRLDTLGTLVINIDMDSLIQASLKNTWTEGESFCVLYNEGQMLYYSPSLGQEAASNIALKAGSNYGIVHNGSTYYFYAKGTIPGFDWKYLFLLPYGFVVNAEHRYVIIAVLFLLFAALLGTICATCMVSGLAVHFKRLITKMKLFGANETQLPASDYDYSVRHDEIGELHRHFDYMAIQIQTLIQNEYENELLTKEAELRSLESQINPHFLYNTLESINWHAKAVNAEEISTMVEALGNMMRLMLDRKRKISTIENELKVVRDYISIISIRYADKIEYIEKIPENLMDIKIPKLSLQPIIENSINYALEEMMYTCVIEVTGCIQDNDMLLRISNTGSQFPDMLLERLESGEITPRGFGIGLTNIHRRIQILFGDAYGLSFENDILEDKAIVTVKVPLMTEAGSDREVSK